MHTKDRLTREGRWQDAQRQVGIGLKDRTLGLIGMGSIGRELMRLAKPLQMRYLVYKRLLSPSSEPTFGETRVSLETLLLESDFVCVAAPLTPETRGMIGESELRKMKPSAFLINAARGAIVDQPALNRALREHWISGAGLDVFETEPIHATDPLMAHDNVILSPHWLGVTDHCLALIRESALRNVLNVFQGKVPPNVVNTEVLANPALKAKLDHMQASGVALARPL